MSNQASLDELSNKKTSQTQENSNHAEIRIGPKKFVVPEEWDFEEIGSIGRLVTGDTPSTDNEDYFGEKFPFITPEDLKKYKYPVDVQRGLTEAGLKQSREIPSGSVIMDCIGSDLGKVGITKTTSATNQQINAIIPEENWNSEFIYYFLQKISPIVKSQAGSTATPILRKSSFSSLELLKPPITEQRRIASVLHNIDQIIYKTEEIIKQAQRVKKGLMQDLFTKGYYNHDKVQETPTGKYPVDWNIVRAGNYLDLSNGEFLKSDERDENAQYPVYGGNGILGYTDDYRVESETILIGRVGAYCGNVQKTKSKAWVTDNAIVVDDEEAYDSGFLAYLLSTLKLGSYSEQSAQPRISQSTVENLRIPLPDEKEQEKISSAIKKFERKISAERKNKKQLQRLKKGLMQDLLTGEIRTNEKVEVLNEVIEVEK